MSNVAPSDLTAERDPSSSVPSPTIENVTPTTSVQPDVANGDAKVRTPQSQLDILFELAAVLSIGVIPNLCSAVFSRSTNNSPFWEDELFRLIYSTCIVVAVLYLLSKADTSFSGFGIPRIQITDFISASFLFVLTSAMARVWWPLITQALLVDQAAAERQGMPHSIKGFEYILLAVSLLVSALSEELVTRSYLITRLRAMFDSTLWAVVISAVLFASYHIYLGPPGFLNALCFGLLFGVAFLLTKTIWPLVIAHFLLNMVLCLSY